jgi:hypothetical protein
VKIQLRNAIQVKLSSAGFRWEFTCHDTARHRDLRQILARTSNLRTIRLIFREGKGYR